MKRSIFLFLVLMNSLLYAQALEKDSLGFETFKMTEGDTTYTMKKYFLVLLKKGEHSDHTPEKAAAIQKEHMAHIQWMAEQGYIDIAGPVGDKGDIRGILIMRVPDKARAEELAAMDPAVKAGRLVMEIHPWWAAKGSQLR